MMNPTKYQSVKTSQNGPNGGSSLQGSKKVYTKANGNENGEGQLGLQIREKAHLSNWHTYSGHQRFPIHQASWQLFLWRPYIQSISSLSSGAVELRERPPRSGASTISRTTLGTQTMSAFELNASCHNSTQTLNSLPVIGPPLSLTQEVPDVALWAARTKCSKLW